LVIPCEVAVKSVVPAIKALIATQLIEKHEMKQEEVAAILGVSQSAVSKYTRKVRGNVIRIDDIEEIETSVNKIVGLLAKRACQRAELLTLFCQICSTIRETGLMCQFCQKADPTIETEKCDFCIKNE